MILELLFLFFFLLIFFSLKVDNILHTVNNKGLDRNLNPGGFFLAVFLSKSSNSVGLKPDTFCNLHRMLDQGLRSKRNSLVRLDTLMCVFSYFYDIENLYVLFHEKFISLSKGQWILKQNWQSVTTPKKRTNELVFLS